MFVNWNSLYGKVTLLSYLFIYTIIRFYFILWLISHYYCYFMAQILPTEDMEVLSGWLLCSLDMFPLCSVVIFIFAYLIFSRFYFFLIFILVFTFGHLKMISIYLLFSLTPTWNKSFI